MKRQTIQGSLFQGVANVETRVISHREDFESLFDGFTKMRAIAYVVSSDLLREFFEKRGYVEIEVVVGEEEGQRICAQNAVGICKKRQDHRDDVGLSKDACDETDHGNGSQRTGTL